MKTTILALCAIALLPTVRAETSIDWYFDGESNKGVYVRADVARMAFSGKDAYSATGGLAAIGYRFSESEDFYHGAEFRVGALFGNRNESSTITVQNAQYKYTSKSSYATIPLIGEYSVAYRVDDDFSVFAAAGGGVLITQQSVKDASVTGLPGKYSPSLTGVAPMFTAGFGVRYNFTRQVQGELGYRFNRVLGSDREGEVKVGNMKYDISTRSDSVNAHMFYAGLAWKY